MPRRTKLNSDVSGRIIRAIRAGNYAKAAAEGAGIGERTFYDWLKRGEDGEEPFAAFAAEVARASADAEVEAVALIRRAMDEDWRAALEFLKRRYPDRWGDRSRTELAGDGRAVEIRFAYDPSAGA